ncbi:heavy-metal-associated domain-containing protein [Ornithinibacillus sp. 179-J 7C1 HS]|uniref:heavy-metal-associated domain-containing protein n=1 Tax=Ornithinibacillus sp. 179-J 7C1 HS TaxID=3142384 RepID=UPI0039A3BD44
MSEHTLFIKEATSETGIKKVEQILNQLKGVERVLIDTNDGEVKVEFNEGTISKDNIISALSEHKLTILH